MRWRRALSEAAIGGVTGAVVVLAFAAARVRGLEDLDHLGSFTVAILTIPLVALSYVLYRETERTRLENSAPRIVVTFEPNRYFGFFDVVIANVGRGTGKACGDIRAAANARQCRRQELAEHVEL